MKLKESVAPALQSRPRNAALLAAAPEDLVNFADLLIPTEEFCDGHHLPADHSRGLRPALDA